MDLCKSCGTILTKKQLNHSLSNYGEKVCKRCYEQKRVVNSESVTKEHVHAKKYTFEKEVILYPKNRKLGTPDAADTYVKKDMVELWSGFQNGAASKTNDPTSSSQVQANDFPFDSKDVVALIILTIMFFLFRGVLEGMLLPFQFGLIIAFFIFSIWRESRRKGKKNRS